MNIEIENVRKEYGSVTALDGLTLTIPSGSTFGLLGTNGAGKTTLFRLLVGHDRPDEGRITVGGIDAESAGVRVRERVGYLPDQIGFPGRLTGREALAFHARMRGVPVGERETRVDSALETVGLTDAADRSVAGYSNGMGRRLGLASVLVGQPDVLVLDEPTAGLDPRGIATFHRIVERVSEETDATVLFASHALDEVERLCDEVAVIHEGRLRLAGTVADVTASVAETTTVRIDATDEAARTAVIETARTFGPVHVDDRVAVECPRAETFALVDALDENGVTGLTIDEPGLDRAFLDAVSEEGVGA